GREFCALASQTPLEPRRIASWLDRLDHAERVAAVRALGRAEQRRLYTAVGGHLPLRLTDLVGPPTRGLLPGPPFRPHTPRAPALREALLPPAGRGPARPRRALGLQPPADGALPRPRLLHRPRGPRPRGGVDRLPAAARRPRRGLAGDPAERTRPRPPRLRVHGRHAAARLGARDDRLGRAPRPRPRLLVRPLPPGVGPAPPPAPPPPGAHGGGDGRRARPRPPPRARPRRGRRRRARRLAPPRGLRGGRAGDRGARSARRGARGRPLEAQGGAGARGVGGRDRGPAPRAREQ